MPRPYFQAPDNLPWSVPLPGKYDPKAPRIPGQTYLGSFQGGPGSSSIPIPSKEIPQAFSTLPGATTMAAGGLGYGDIGIILASILSGALGGGGNSPFQQYEPFTGSISAPQMLGAGVGQANAMLDALAKQANQPVHLPGAFAQSLPGFGGGGLPMNIGAPAIDPGFANKNLFDLPGLGLPMPFGGGNDRNVYPGSAGTGGRHAPPLRPGEPPRDVAIPRPPGQVPGTGPRQSQSMTASANPHDEAEQVLDMLGVRRGRSLVS